MRCKKCDSHMSEGELFCHECGYQGRLEEQRAKIKMLKIKHRGIVLDKVHSPLFLILAIFMSLMTVIKVIPLVYADFSVLLEAAFLIMATVGLWISFAAKENYRLARSLRLASVHDAFIRVIFTIVIVFGAIFLTGLVIAVFAIAGGVATGREFGSGAFTSQELFTIGIAIFVIGSLGLSLISLIRRVFASRRAYFVRLARFIETGEYSANASPAISSFVFGTLAIILGICALALSVNLLGAITQLINLMFGSFSGFADFLGVELSGTDMLSLSDLLKILEAYFAGDGIFGGLFSAFLGYINALVSGISLIFAVGGVSATGTGLYFIISAVWITSTHRALDTLRREIDRENVRRIEIDRNTKEAVATFERDRARQKAEEIVEGFVNESEETVESEPVAELAERIPERSPDFFEEATEEASVDEAPIEESFVEEEIKE